MKLLLQSNGGFSGFYSKFILIDTDLHKMVKTDGLMKDGLTGIKYILFVRISIMIFHYLNVFYRPPKLSLMNPS